MARPKGNVYQVGKAWRVKYPMGKDPRTGKYRTIQETYPTEAAAWDRLNRLRVEESDGTLVAPSRITVRQFSDRWLDAKRATVRGSTVRVYRNAIQTLAPELADVPLVKVDAPALLAWHARLLESVQPTTVRDYHRTIRMMLDDAVKWGYLARNTARDVKPPSPEPPEIRVWSRQQIEAFLLYIEGRDDEALWRLLITTGLRVGELCALQWGDLFGDHLTIRHTVSRDDRGRQVVAEPKTRASRRVLILSSRTVAALRTHHDQIQAARARYGDWWNADDWMFPGTRGGLMATAVVRERLKRLCTDSGLPYIGPHGLRHTYGTDLMRAGVAPRIVQERMGHSNVTITLNLYSHPDSDMHRAVADTIERGGIEPVRSGFVAKR